MTATELLEAALATLPYPDRIRDIDIHGAEVRFTWSGERWRVSNNGLVEAVQGGVLACSNAAMLMEALISRGLQDIRQRKVA
jgi:hypothetical protein